MVNAAEELKTAECARMTTAVATRRTYLTAAQALERLFTPRRVKRLAALLLRSCIKQPHCSFCGTGAAKFEGSDRPRLGYDLRASLCHPNTWICVYCASYIAYGLKHKDEDWARLKDCAP